MVTGISYVIVVFHLDVDDWGFDVPFRNFSAISAQPSVFFVLSMIESMGMNTTQPGHSRQ